VRTGVWIVSASVAIGLVTAFLLRTRLPARVVLALLAAAGAGILLVIAEGYFRVRGQEGLGMGWFLFQLVAIFGIFYFLIIRPQRKQQQRHRQLLGSLQRGDRVVTSGGIIGKVIKVMDNDEVLVEIAEDVRIRVVKSTISDIRSKTEPADKPANDAK